MANWVRWFLLSSQSPVALPVIPYPIIVPLAAGGDHLPEKHPITLVSQHKRNDSGALHWQHPPSPTPLHMIGYAG
jgi:hypothetical protein